MQETIETKPASGELFGIPLSPLRQYVVRSRYTRRANRHFNHSTFVHGHLCSIFGHPLPSIRRNEPLPEWILIPNVVESGHIDYDEGDDYNFGITVVGSKVPLGDWLVQQFSQKITCPTPAIRDTALGFADLTEVPITDFEDQISHLRDKSTLTLHFTSPLLIEQRFPNNGQRTFSPDYFDAPHFFKTLYSRIFDLAKIDLAEEMAYAPPPPPEVRILKNHLLWVNIPHPTAGTSEPEYFGAIGKVVLTGNFDEWIPALVTGQYLHLGKRTAFGFGRYRIAELDQIRTDEIGPAKPLLLSVIGPHNLSEAADHIRANCELHDSESGSGSVDFESIAMRLREQIVDGHYKSSELHGAIIKKEDGSNRYLAIPSIPDRVLQRATTQVLAPVFEKLFEDSSFAYRTGRSRLQAADQVETWHRDGYHYIVKADIESFFDLVNWELLFDKLDALLPSEPLIELVKSWVKLDVRFQGRTIRRCRGIPQGSPISPLLANLYLDEFDEFIQNHGFRLARYADDFVILCPSKDQAETALRAAKEALQKLKLQLNEHKTELTDFDHGFRYLGYLFLRSSVIDVHKDESPTSYKAPDLFAESIAEHAWKSALVESDNQLESAPAAESIDDKDSAAESDQTQKATLYLDSPDLRIRVENKILIVSDVDSGEEHEFPLAKLSHLVVRQGPHITAPAILTSLDSDVPVFFTRVTGSIRAALNLKPADWQLWQLQAEAKSDSEFCLRFAKEVVGAKLNNQAVVLRDRKEDDTATVVHRINALAETCERADNVEAARGYEGAGAREYWEEFGRLLGPQWKFPGRIKHPATDPVNAMLSFGYTILYHHSSTALQMAGLNPTLGLFHEPRGNFHALAADLQEEFRHLVDGVVLRMIRKGEVHADDFQLVDQGEGILLSQSARKQFMGAIEDRLLTEFTPPQSNQKIAYRGYIADQAHMIASLMRNRKLLYRALRIR